MDALRHINGKVDRLIEILGSQPRGGVAGGPTSGPAGTELSKHFLRLASILDPTELFTAVVEAGLEVLGGQRAFLTMLEENNKLRFKWGVNVDQNMLASPTFAYGRTLIKKVLQNGKPFHLDAAQAGGLGGVFCAPLCFGKRLDGNERVGGAVYVEGNVNGNAEQQLQTLLQLADQAAIALENSYIFKQGQEGSHQITRLKDNINKLYEVGQSIASTLILGELLERVIDHVISISRAQRGFIMLVGDDERFVGRDSRQRNIKRDRFPFSTTVVRKCVEEKKSQIHKELPEADLSASMVSMELQSILSVPLLEKSEVFGLVYVDSQQSNKEFDESDAEIVESLCGQAQIAVINAKLYEEAKDAERLAHELELASKIQSDLLPKTIPNVVGLEMHGLLVPATEVGGDYYDFIPHEGTDSSVTIAIGDVSGKGVGAGLVMAMCRSALRSLVQHQGVPTTPLNMMRSLNLMMVRDIPPHMFMTINLLIWDASTRTLKYTPAGHEHLLVYRARTRDVESIRAGGMACGVVKEASAAFQERTLKLDPGDHLVLYTDGVTEAMNEQNDQYGLDTTIDLIRRGGHSDPKRLCEGILKKIIEFRGNAEPHDDITLVALKAT